MYTDRDGKRVKQAIASGWNEYMDYSQYNGSYLYDTYGQYNDEIVGTIDRTREYSGYVGVGATPFLFFPPTTPIAAGVIAVTGGMALGAGATESYVTQNASYLKEEGFGFVAGAFGGKFVQGVFEKAGKVSEVVYNSSAGRYMGKYANGAYGFVKNTTGQLSLAISQTTEQAVGWISQRGMK